MSLTTAAYSFKLSAGATILVAVKRRPLAMSVADAQQNLGQRQAARCVGGVEGINTDDFACLTPDQQWRELHKQRLESIRNTQHHLKPPPEPAQPARMSDTSYIQSISDYEVSGLSKLDHTSLCLYVIRC